MPQSLDGINKRCCTCTIERPISYFSLDKNRPDGHDPRCRVCRTATPPEDREIPVNMKPNRLALSQALAEYLNTTLDCSRAIEEGHIAGNLLVTNAQKIALKLIDQSVNGDHNAIRTVLERVEGSVKQTMQVDTTITANQQLVKNADELLQKLRGLPPIESTSAEPSTCKTTS